VSHSKESGTGSSFTATKGAQAVYGHGTFVFDPVAALDMLFLAFFKSRSFGGDTNS